MAYISIPTSKSAGNLLFWVCLCLTVSALQTLVPNGQKYTVRQPATTLPTEVQTTAYIIADPGHGNGGTLGSVNMGICQALLSLCVNSTNQACYELLVNHWCKIHFVEAMMSINSTDWCSLDRIKSAYNNFTVCTETTAECLLLPWPNQFIEQTFVDIHATYFQECPSEAMGDPPTSIILALVMTPICLIPVMVVLVVLKTKN